MEVEVPFVDEDVDTSEPTSALMTIVMLVAGFGVLLMTRSIGGYLAGEANSLVGSVLGFNPATGDSEGVDLL